MLKELKENVGKVKKMIYEWNGNISEKTENPERNQTEIVELKSTITNLKIHQICRESDVGIIAAQVIVWSPPQQQKFGIHPWTKVPLWELRDPASYTKGPKRSGSHLYIR